jgi:endoglucanase
MNLIKKVILLAPIALFLLSCQISNKSYNYMDQINQNVETVSSTLPFFRGVNFTTWFEASSPQSIVFSTFTEQDFIDAKTLGIEVIRLPIKMHDMTGGSPDYRLDPFFLSLLDHAVDWAEKHQIYLILDNHSFDPSVSTSADIGGILIPVWQQMARRYRNRSDYILYEILNEPHGIETDVWAEIQERAVRAIREIDPDRWIVVGGAGWNSIDEMLNLPAYPYDKLIYTFHFYDPHIFTHQGATWGDPPTLGPLRGVPFPFDAHEIPEVPKELIGTWMEGNLKYSYSRDGTVSALERQLDKAVRFSLERGVPVFCGEFGVFIPNVLSEDRVRWYEIVGILLDLRGIVRTSWDYFGGFGIFKTDRGGSIHSDLNTDIVKALGFKVPRQRPPEKIRNAFTLFDNYTNSQVLSFNNWGCDVNMYYPSSGKYAVAWNNINQYGSMNFIFKRDIDWEYLLAQDYAVVFTAKADKPSSFDVRFVNNENENAIPWRLRASANIAADGNWHTVRIPLSSMREHGAWVNSTQQWYNPRSEFSWTDIASLSFVAEEGSLSGITILFDTIRIER